MENKKERGRKSCIFLITILAAILFSGNIPALKLYLVEDAAGGCFDCLEKGSPYGSRNTCVSQLSDCDLSSPYALNFYYGWDSECRCEKDENGIPRVVKNNVCEFNADYPRQGYTLYGRQRNMSLCPPCAGRKVPVGEVLLSAENRGDYLIETCEIPGGMRRGDPYFACLATKECYQCKYESLGLGEGRQWSGYYVRREEQVNPDDFQLRIKFGSPCDSYKVCPIHPECPGDTNGDGERDISDLITVTNKHESKNCDAENGCCQGADLNGDTVVDASDFLMVVGNYEESCPDL